MIHTTKDHVSFGSHPQGRPHACSAQIAPAMMVNVHVTNPTPTIRYAQISSFAAEGSDPMIRRNGEVFSPDSRLSPASVPVSVSASSTAVVDPEPAALLVPTDAVVPSSVRLRTREDCLRLRRFSTCLGAAPTVFFSAACWASCSIANAAPIYSSAVERVATDTWMMSQ